MKNRNKKFWGTLGFLLIGVTSYAQFTLSGEIRPRTEFRHGYKSLADSGAKSATFTDQRTRLNFDYKTESYSVFVQFQDIRTWGSQSQLNTVDGLSSIHQAYGIANINKKLSFKFGRQELVYDDHRILGSVNWTQQARSHDAGLFVYKDSTWTLHVGGAYNQNKPQMNTTSYTGVKNYKSMQFLWFHKDWKDLKFSFLVLNNGLQVNALDSKGNAIYHDNYSQTIGTHTKYKKNKLMVTFNGYYQTGKTNSSPAQNVNAYLLGLDAAYKATEKLTAIIGYELQSGQSQTSTTTSSTAFNPLYGTNHKFNGFMDYFYVGNHINNVGLQDIYLKIKYKNKKIATGVDAHLFSAAQNVLDQQELIKTGTVKAMSANLGTEIDAYIGFNLAKGVRFKAGYSQMFGTNTLAAIKGVSDYKGAPYTGSISNWAYGMIIIKPTFISK